MQASIAKKTGIVARENSVAAMPAALKKNASEKLLSARTEFRQLAAASEASAERQSLSAMRGTVGNCRTEEM